MFGRRKNSNAATPDNDDAATVADTEQAEQPAKREGFDFDPQDGPFDKSVVPDVEAFYKDLGYGYLNLGTIVLGIPPNAQLNAALSQDGTPEFHVVSEAARVIPRAFSAPRSGGQWRTFMSSIREQLDNQGATTFHEDGPWGRELVAEQSNAMLRLIGVEGPRWMLEVRVVSTKDKAEEAMEQAHEIVGRFIVNRGTDPMPAGELLPMDIPEEITASLNQARQQLAQQQAATARTAQAGAQAQGQGAAAARPNAGAAAPAGGQPAAPAPNAAQNAAQNQAPAPHQVGGGSVEPPQMKRRKRTSAMNRLHELDDEK